MTDSAKFNYTQTFCFKKDQTPPTLSFDDLISRISAGEDTYEFLKEDMRCLYFDIEIGRAHV